MTGLKFEKRGEEFLNEVQAYEKNIRLQSEAVKEKENFSFDYFFNQTHKSTDNDDDDSSSDDEDIEIMEDDEDENYEDVSSGDECVSKSPSTNAKKLQLNKKKASKSSA